ncbi:unnamed protein product, partial [Cylicocyclus nassatus]
MWLNWIYEVYEHLILADHACPHFVHCYRIFIFYSDKTVHILCIYICVYLSRLFIKVFSDFIGDYFKLCHHTVAFVTTKFTVFITSCT